MIKIKKLYDIFTAHPTIVTDSRKVVAGCLFIALKGDKFDGNAFAQQALEAGAAYTVIDNAAYKTDDRCLLVEDTLLAVQQLANFHRKTFDIPIIAITGSNGKTTTKELVSAVLSSHYPLHFTKGNLNNHIGVPLTLLEMPRTTEVAVIEMGANHQKEIELLCQIAEPTHGIITNIGKAHLEGFGDLEGIKQGKSELYEYLTAHYGLAFVNGDEDFLLDLAKIKKTKILLYKRNDFAQNPNAFEAQLIDNKPFINIAFLSYNNERITVNSHLVGIYNFNNILTAVALGKYFKVPSDKIKIALENYIPTNNRSQILEKDGNTYLMDAYNANPTSMKNAILNFDKMIAPHKIAIIGDMFELGEHAAQEHQDIATIAAECNLENLILVGKNFELAAKSLNINHFIHTDDLKRWFVAQQFKGKYFLIKGSRSMGLEKLIQ